MDVDFNDPEFAENPLPFLNDLRSQGDVVWSSRLNAWLILSYDLVEEGLSSREHERAGEYIHEFASVIPFLNGDANGQARRVVADRFSATRIESMTTTVRGLAEAAIDQWPHGVPVDFATQFSDIFTSRVICNALQLPDLFAPDMVTAIDSVLDFFGRLPPSEQDIASIRDVFRTTVGRIVGHFELTPPTSVFHFDEWDSQTAALISMALLFTGIGTARSGINSAVFRLVKHGLLPRLRRDEASVSRFVEESIRFDSANQFVTHRALQDMVLGDREVKAGERLMFMIGAANHDPMKFERPDEFDIDRREQRHLGFGAGEHYCLGNHLARLELREVVKSLSVRFQDAEFAGKPVWVQRQNFRTIASMPIRWSA